MFRRRLLRALLPAGAPGSVRAKALRRLPEPQVVAGCRSVEDVTFVLRRGPAAPLRSIDRKVRREELRDDRELVRKDQQADDDQQRP